MTQAEAYKVLGISRFVSPSRIEQAYREQQKQLRLKLIQGNPLADRQKAQTELARLATAGQALQVTLTAKSYPGKPVPKKTTRARPTRARRATVNYCQKPQTLADAWEQFLQLSPFPEHVTMILLVLTFLIVLTGLLATCLRKIIMGILPNLLLSFVHLLLIAIDVTTFFVLIRILCHRWHFSWLESFNSVGKPLVDGFTVHIQKLVKHISHKSFSQRGLLNIGIVTLVIVRILLVALFRKYA
jgi:hypothetical protein